MSVKVTGCTGFVGKNLIPYLSVNRINVDCINRDKFKNDADHNLNGYEAIIHLAGKAHDLQKTSNPNEYYQANFELTKKLYDTFLISNAKKFIFISSVKAVADSVNGILKENYLPNPQTHYGKSKLMAEEYIQRQPLHEGKSYYILRPCMVHGPGNKGNLNLLYQFVSKGLPYPLAAFENQRSFLSVENLCFIIKEILDRKDIPSGIYNVADDEALSTNEVVSLISKSIGKSPRLLAIPKKLIAFISQLGSILKLPLNTERLGKLTSNYIVSNKKIKKVLQKDFPLSSREGIIRTIQSFKC